MNKNNLQIQKAVFPVAGLGTRFLPATKASPKEMMPVVDKPLIQYAVEEALSIGIKELIFVTSSTKRAIEDHFDRNFELESRLKQEEKEELLNTVQHILPKDVHCIYIRQAEPLGLGHAVLCAQPVIGQEPFAVLLADDLIESQEVSCLSQMLQTFKRTAHSVVAVQPVGLEDLHKYGIIKVPPSFSEVGPISGIIEKPREGFASSHFGAIGRYLLTPAIFKALERSQASINGEIQLTDAIQSLLAHEPVQACVFKGKRYDCGSKLGYLEAIVQCGLKHPVLRDAFKKFLQQLMHQ